MDPSSERRELVTLDPAECATLLALETVGRLAAPHPSDGPDVIPVNFVLRDGDPVFRTHDGVILDRILGQRVSLQVDRFDWFHRTGWSVLVRGVAELDEETADGSADPRRDPDTWLPGDQPRLVRIRADRVTGRRIELHQVPLDGRGYL